MSELCKQYYENDVLLAITHHFESLLLPFFNNTYNDENSYFRELETLVAKYKSAINLQSQN